MACRYFTVDAFTSRPFTGNPAGVCLIEGEVSPDWMQAVAGEMRHSETAFVRRSGTGWEIRWFTPTMEVDLCGHATCAAAHVLVEEGEEEEGAIVSFSSAGGDLEAVVDAGTVTLTFPALPAEAAPVPAGLEAALGVPVEDFRVSTYDWLVRTGGAILVEGAAPDMKALEGFPARGIILTAASDGGRYDIISRFFAPAAGIPEDPVTGSAHCVLGPYWQHLTGRDHLQAFQASKRGGEIMVTVDGDEVLLTGRAVTVLRGMLE
ncbi:hypothetical protein AZH53_07295 [Methanomicrobiaceae archaeon CYW5]|uniref:PhzF family phenazine biosynthesis protein n=1 Tax=Methanovulcanius yangii TaxID=1789227 RepID=UPI0029CA5B3D|nr:PhzF family phenazine biosynthesis protein [Methanovulcanius yangii]MBT8508208.1 hypothetical protein [Methanovulcanius yangii]